MIVHPVEKDICICYFDLRKYSYLATKFQISEQITYLEDYHNIVETKCLNNQGILYHLNADVSIYYFQPDKFDLVNLLIDIKESVDQYFKELDFPCRLHISSALGIGIFAEIKTNNSIKMNIFGDVMNHFQQTINFSESEMAINSNDRIILHESLKGFIEEEVVFERNQYNKTEFISLK